MKVDLTKHIWKIWAFLLLPLVIEAQTEFSSSNLPIILIDTYGSVIEDDPRITASMKVLSNESSDRNELSNPNYTYEGEISIEIRGSFSQNFPKKQYGFTTLKANGEEDNVALLGLPEEHDWILNAPYADKSLMRNILAYELGRRMGHYAPRTKLCEVVLNGEYQGVYVLIEKIKRDKNRVDIAKLKPDEIDGDDVTGGYIIKIDKTTGDEDCEGWISNYADTYIQYEYPKCENIQEAQQEYIQEYVYNFEAALYGSDYMSDEEGYRKYADVNSMIDFLIINEISKNVDGYRLSTFIYKDKESKNGKLTFGPLWDYNIAFGNANYLGGEFTNRIIAQDRSWWRRVLTDTTFQLELSTRWLELRNSTLSNESINNIIDSVAFEVSEAQVRNFKKWDILSEYVKPNAFIGDTYEAEVAYLKDWIANRLSWLDKINAFPEPEYNNSVFYPNPFNNFFEYKFKLNTPGLVSLEIHDMRGRLVSSLINLDNLEQGEHEITFYSNKNQFKINTGVYILTLKSNGEILDQKRIVNQY